MTIPRTTLTAIATAVIGMATVAAQAAPLPPINLAAMKNAASPETVQVRWGGYRGGGYRGIGYRGGYRGGYGYRRGGYGYRGIGYGRGYGYRPYYGLAAGALIGGAIANSPYYGSYPYYGGYGYSGGCEPYSYYDY